MAYNVPFKSFMFTEPTIRISALCNGGSEGMHHYGGAPSVVTVEGCAIPVWTRLKVAQWRPHVNDLEKLSPQRAERIDG